MSSAPRHPGFPGKPSDCYKAGWCRRLWRDHGQVHRFPFPLEGSLTSVAPRPCGGGGYGNRGGWRSTLSRERGEWPHEARRGLQPVASRGP